MLCLAGPTVFLPQFIFPRKNQAHMEFLPHPDLHLLMLGGLSPPLVLVASAFWACRCLFEKVPVYDEARKIAP